MTRRDMRLAAEQAMPSSEDEMARRSVAQTSERELFVALLQGWCLGAVVPLALDRVERDPLCSAGRFDGELLRALMEVPSSFWARHPRLHTRFLDALRRAAMMRRRLPLEERMRFWTPLDQAALAAPHERNDDEGHEREH